MTKIRIGQGFDVHAFGDGDHVMLGGVRVPHTRGVLAHSDGDVALHALGEFGATILFAGNLPGRTQTMPLAIYLGFELDIGVAVALAVVLVGVSFAILLLIKLVSGREVPHD